MSKKEDKENRPRRINARITEEEYNTIKQMAINLGYKKNFSEFIRKQLFNKKLISVNPNLLIDELYLLRAEVNKIGSNINQIANYTNFLKNQNYIDNKMEEDLKKISSDFKSKIDDIKSKIDEAIGKTV